MSKNEIAVRPTPLERRQRLLYADPTSNDCRLAPALDLCRQKSFFAARQGLLDFAKVCRVADPRDRVQRRILTAELIIRREAQVAESIPHVVAAIQLCLDRLKAVVFD